MKVSDLIRGGRQPAGRGIRQHCGAHTLQGREWRKPQHRADQHRPGVRIARRFKADLVLEPFDLLNVKELPQWEAQESVLLQGRSTLPRPICDQTRGRGLKSVVARAGGFDGVCLLRGAVCSRVRICASASRSRSTSCPSDCNTSWPFWRSLQSVAASQGQSGGAAISVGQSLLGQLRQLEGGWQVGHRSEPYSWVAGRFGRRCGLARRRRLIVPKFEQEVSVIGEVQNATSHLYRAGLSRDDYIALSGGATRRADRSHIYVVRATAVRPLEHADETG